MRRQVSHLQKVFDAWNLDSDWFARLPISNSLKPYQVVFVITNISDRYAYTRPFSAVILILSIFNIEPHSRFLAKENYFSEVVGCKVISENLPFRKIISTEGTQTSKLIDGIESFTDLLRPVSN